MTLIIEKPHLYLWHNSMLIVIIELKNKLSGNYSKEVDSKNADESR